MITNVEATDTVSVAVERWHTAGRPVAASDGESKAITTSTIRWHRSHVLLIADDVNAHGRDA
ncbi:hypothetical protein ELQ92_02785 [Labedella populi]|uniref:Uncharacterized protein n=1 Tax=Labedella populi TaxID=2498850 RepID=A0A444QF45_9MICO|nr:hypothetical protein [Labedella populi]RWZ68179.1 hypothetical protein ELQ92_02785 [Labedella populi]